MADFCRVFQAIADDHRQRILLLLEDHDRCVGELVARFSLSQSAVSKHLAVLKNAGLVADKRCGQQVIYSLNRQNLQDCCREYFIKFECCSSLFAQHNGEKQREG